MKSGSQEVTRGSGYRVPRLHNENRKFSRFNQNNVNSHRSIYGTVYVDGRTVLASRLSRRCCKNTPISVLFSMDPSETDSVHACMTRTAMLRKSFVGKDTVHNNTTTRPEAGRVKVTGG